MKNITEWSGFRPKNPIIKHSEQRITCIVFFLIENNQPQIIIEKYENLAQVLNEKLCIMIDIMRGLCPTPVGLLLVPIPEHPPLFSLSELVWGHVWNTGENNKTCIFWCGVMKNTKGKRHFELFYLQIGI